MTYIRSCRGKDGLRGPLFQPLDHGSKAGFHFAGDDVEASVTVLVDEQVDCMAFAAWGRAQALVISLTTEKVIHLSPP